MFIRYFTILFCCYVCSIHCLSAFIDKGQRAELFERMDDEVPIFNINISEEDFSLMKKKANMKIYDISVLFYLLSQNWKYKASRKEKYGFKTKNATLSVKFKNDEKYFEKVTFSLGGNTSRLFPRPGYNLKIRGKDDLYGRKQFKIRSDCNEPTYLRRKLISDMRNHLKLPSVSANYIQLYVNNEFMGSFIISDAYKPSWINFVYGEKDTKNLYKCENMIQFSLSESDGCFNENKEATDNSELLKFLSSVENASSAEELEDIFEIDHFLKEMALDYLLGSWDHVLNGHNYYLYKQPNGKWIYLSHDYDHDFGQPLLSPEETTIEKFFNSKIHIIDLLVLKNAQRFEKILNEVVRNVFNPDTLYPRIDELKRFIKPYVLLDKTPNDEGEYPGEINKKFYGERYDIQQWDDYSEFTTGKTDRTAYGLKNWILMQYRNVCRQFDMKCNPIYLDENYKYTGPKSVSDDDTELELDSNNASNSNHDNDNSTKSKAITSSSIPTNKCIVSEVYNQEDDEDWDYDLEELLSSNTNDESLSLSDLEEECWSKILGYPCCMGCEVYETDSYGSWGYESRQWCGIPSYCDS